MHRLNRAQLLVCRRAGIIMRLLVRTNRQDVWERLDDVTLVYGCSITDGRSKSMRSCMRGVFVCECDLHYIP